MVNQEQTQGTTAFRVTPEQEEFILQQLAEGYTYAETQERFKNKFNLYVSETTIQKYSSQQEDLILEKRKALQYHLDKIIHASKFFRVKQLGRQIDKVLKEVDDPRQQALVIKELYEQIRKEIDGFKTSLSFDTGNPFDSLSGKVDIQALNRELDRLKREEREKTENGTKDSEIVDVRASQGFKERGT